MRLTLVVDCAYPEVLAPFWAEALHYAVVGTVGPYMVLVPQDGSAPALVLQRVPEPKAGKNRVHFDVRVDDLDPEVERLVALGAARLTDGVIEENGFRWVVLADPEGNEFCVCVEPWG